MAALEAELPAFIHFILYVWQVPGDIECSRYGVVHYHQPELLQMMSTLAPETKLLELIDTKLWPKDAPVWNIWEGKASDLEAELTKQMSGVEHEARKLLLYNSACGQYLGRLMQQHPGRISKRILKGMNIWEIQPPARIRATD